MTVVTGLEMVVVGVIVVDEVCAEAIVGAKNSKTALKGKVRESNREQELFIERGEWLSKVIKVGSRTL